MTVCSSTFASGTAVSIVVNVTNTTASMFFWDNYSSPSPCPEMTGSPTNGGSISNMGPTIEGNLICSWTMTSATKNLGFYIS
jgi:hypothetical protein